MSMIGENSSSKIELNEEKRANGGNTVADDD